MWGVEEGGREGGVREEGGKEGGRGERGGGEIQLRFESCETNKASSNNVL